MLLAQVSCSDSSGKSQQINVTYMEQMSVAPADYPADFKEIDSIVRANYTHIEAKGLDMDALYTSFNSRVELAQTPVEYGFLLREYFAALENIHTVAFFKNYYLDFNVELIEGKVLLKRIGKGVDTLNSLGVQLKDEIVAIDGKPISLWLEENSKFTSASTVRSREHYTAWAIKYSYVPTERTYTIKTSSGLKDITLDLCEDNNIYSGQTQTVEQRVLADSIGYIAINTMGDERVVELFTQALSQVGDLPYLILDLRNNGGGNSGYSEQILKYLIAETQEASVSREFLQPADNRYKGEIFVLTDVGCGSAAESLAIDLKESGNATLVGMPTAGDTGNVPRAQVTSFGTSFNIPTRKTAQVSPQGFAMEGIGLEPHHRVEPTLSDYMNGVDTQLEYVINLRI